MATRAELISEAKSDLGELGAGLSSTDSAGQKNYVYYALNKAMARCGLVDADLASITNDQRRILLIGTQFYTLQAVVKNYISIPRVDASQVSRDTFARIMELLRFLDDEFRDALSGKDIPPEISRPAEQVVTWATGFDGGDSSGRNSEGNVSQINTNDLYIDDLGRDLTTYEDDGD